MDFVETSAGILLAHQAIESVARCPLTVREHEQLAQRTHPRVQAEFIVGRSLAKHLAVRFFGGALADWQVIQLSSGAPQLQPLNGVAHGAISISHSRERIAVMLGSKSKCVGLDVERLRERREPRELLKLICQKNELAWYDALPTLTRFYQLWTAKEAIAKVHQSSLWDSHQAHAAIHIQNKLWTTSSGLQIHHFHHTSSQHIGAWTIETLT